MVAFNREELCEEQGLYVVRTNYECLYLVRKTTGRERVCSIVNNTVSTLKLVTRK